LTETFHQRGFRSCSWHELASLTGASPSQVVALSALASAQTARTASILLDQYRGAFDRALAAILDCFDQDRHQQAGDLLRNLAANVDLGRHLTHPWRVVIAGAPNVGKSSLVNALTGYARCIVAPTPGTPRDLVTTVVAVHGWPIELADTAGLRGEATDLEAQGMELARTAIASADLCLWMLDASTVPAWPERRTDNMRWVINKIDLSARWD